MSSFIRLNNSVTSQQSPRTRVEISQGDKNNPEEVAVTLARPVAALAPPPPPHRRTRSHHSLSLTRRAARAGRPLRSLRAQGVAPRRRHEKTSILLFFPLVAAPPANDDDDVHDGVAGEEDENDDDNDGHGVADVVHLRHSDTPRVRSQGVDWHTRADSHEQPLRIPTIRARGPHAGRATARTGPGSPRAIGLSADAVALQRSVTRGVSEGLTRACTLFFLSLLFPRLSHGATRRDAMRCGAMRCDAVHLAKVPVTPRCWRTHAAHSAGHSETGTAERTVLAWERRQGDRGEIPRGT